MEETKNNYQKFLISWISDIISQNKVSFNYNNINDIAIGVYLLSKDLKLSQNDRDKVFEYFDIPYNYTNLIKKLVSELYMRNPDLMELLTEITTKNYLALSPDFKNHIEILYDNEKLSEEENKETLIFGDNILNGEMTSRELCDTIRIMTIDYVDEYISNLNLGEITFTISDSSIMYLKDTDGIKICTVYIKDSTSDNNHRHVIRYTNENGSALFLLFEPRYIKTETIYGLSLDTNAGEERGLLILEKNKDESVYRFLFGRGEF